MSSFAEMTFLEHAMELRKRVVQSLWGVLITFGISYHFAERLYDWMLMPLCDAFHSSERCPIVYTGVAEPFMVYLKVGIVGGLFLGAPWIFYQIWRFISPGLKASERRYVIPFVATASLMFIGGALLGYFFIFPVAFPFFRDQAGAFIQPMLSMDSYFSFAAGLLFAFGALFEVPVFVVLLNFIGILHSRSLWKSWRIGVCIIFVLAAVLTPTDPYTMLLLGTPLAILYLVALCICSIHDRLWGRA